MYTPRHFLVADDTEKLAFIAANNFAQLISNVDGRIYSTHLPFLVNHDKTCLLGHLARQNPQHETIAEQEVLITFQGAHDYISPTWFATPGVPTWNYQAVHVYGRCRVLHEPGQIAEIVDALTRRHESKFTEPWQPQYQSTMLSAIVGIEVTITEIQGKYKLSQNRTLQDQRQIKANLDKNGSTELASTMLIDEPSKY